jgi:predicted DNA-binding transcriptional regulator AlpA
MANRGEKQVPDRLHDLMSEFSQEVADRLHVMMRESAQDIATEVVKVLKADKSEGRAPVAPVVLPRLTPSSLKYLEQRHLAKIFNVTSRTIYNWRIEGKLPAVRLLPNGREVWREDEIEMWMATRIKPKKE